MLLLATSHINPKVRSSRIGERSSPANRRRNTGGDKFGFRYNYGPVRTYLTPKYGGRPKSGGGGDNEFEIVMRLVAALMS